MPPNVTTEADREVRRRIRVVVFAIVASLVVSGTEISFAWLLGLESLLAEGIHTFLDAVDSVIVLIAIILAAKPADRTHQFGHGKFEAVGAAIEGAFMACAAIGIGYRGIDRLIHGRTPEQIPAYVCAVMLVAAGIYFIISMYLMREARRTRSPAILAEAMHLRTHIFITGGIAGGLLIGALGDWPIADTLLALGVAVCLLFMSLHVFREVFAQFTDAALPESEIEILGEIINRYSDSFVEVHGIRTRQSGSERQIEMHLVVMPETTVADAHRLSHKIEDAIAEKWPTTRTTVHIEPLNMEVKEYQSRMTGQPKVQTNEAFPEEREFIH
ncbi:MAG: cation diffusion facilitator family transporter [Phycisphaerales bacterium]|nr:cation diffusion facilitator family transporter [Phycisphaerales bacterium]